jgi:quercetin dioxygenase-like cupin family protein
MIRQARKDQRTLVSPVVPVHDDPVVRLETPFVDRRGTIQGLLELPVRSVAIIESEPGAVRANHYHKTDWHYCYVVSGEIEYFERTLNSTEEPSRTVIKQGELFFTPPLVEHAMRFSVKTTFLTFSRNPRDHAAYESDVVRVKVITD